MQVNMKLHGALAVLLLASISISTADEKDPPPAPTPTPPPSSTPKPAPKTSKCTNRKVPDGLPDTPDKPELSDVFETTIEATFIKANRSDFKPYTMEIKEFYDIDNNKAAVTTLKDGTESRLLYDVANSYAFTAKKEKGKEQTCDEGVEIKEHPTKTDKPIPIYFDFSKTDKGGTISGLSDAFKFGGNYSADFLGYKKVRGRESQLWSTCVYYDNYGMNFYVDWYFSKPDYRMPMGKEHVVPVRLEITGFSGDLGGVEPEEGKVKYHIQYDFVSYRNSISDPSVFWPELKTLCGGDKYYGKRNPDQPPKVEDTFSVNMEKIYHDGRVTNGKYVMDGTNNLMRTDVEVKDDNSNYKGKCTGTCKIIHDFSVGIEYVFQSNGTCSIYNIEVKKDGGPPDAMTDLEHRDKDNKTTLVMLATAAQLFHIGKGYNLDYQGERLFRGVKTNAYVVVETAKPKGPYREFHFTQETPPKLFGYIENGEKAQFQTNFYNFDATTVDMSAFDIDACFPEKMTDKLPDFKILHGRLELKETWDKVKKVGLVKVQPEVRKTLAKKAGVNTLRITNMLITPEDGKPDGTASTIVWFTLLGPSPVAGSAWHAVDVINPMKDTEKAEHDLENALEDDVALKIVTGKDKDGKDTTSTITLKGDSLKLVEDILDEDPRAPVPSGSSGHSNGQMALCGIISLVFGAFIGLGVGFYLWKRRNRGVPYQIHH